MHIVFFADQHLDSLGGAQVSMRLQRRFLEEAGHTVTVVAPAMHGPRAARGEDAGNVDVPSAPITWDREYAFSAPGRRTDRFVDDALAARPPIDVVHVQADFWGAFIGHRFARRHGLPVVHTMHNRVDVGIRAVSPMPGLTLWAINAWQRGALGVRGARRALGVRGGSERRRIGRMSEDSAQNLRQSGDSPTLDGGRAGGSDGWAYLRGLAAGADAVTAPSGHFARRLERHGVFPHVDVVWNGIDDDVLDAVLAAAAPPPAPERRSPAPEPVEGRPRFIWLGRMSPEKRLLPFLDAVAVSGIDADVEVLGGGAQLRAARRLVEKRRPQASIVFGGRMSYPETLRRIAAADALVQTSIGFETQGMTPFEAASLGTPAVISDPDIAGELESGFWAVGGGRDAAPAHGDDSVAALAATLRSAAADIAAGDPVPVNPTVRERFRQSSRTAAMLEVYDRVVA
ncbi:MAG: glycosyltransferase [Microbacterium sp.]|uniref:glycosyltransferase n=1 Tax=Microbacterium sp. TaxID=51671 RepID=UPI0039E57756